MPETNYYSSTTSPTFTKAKMPFSWPSLPNPIPRRVRRRLRSKFRSNASPASSIASIETSFNPKDTLRALRSHRWSVYDGQYLILIIIAIFSLSISQAPGPLMKTGAATLLMLALLMPVTRQFFLPVLPIFTWLVFFFNARFIPAEYRPHIWVKVLPALENIFYGANISNILSAHQYVVLDVLAWLPYGILHFGGPFVWAALMFLFGPPGTVPVFARTFGYLNIIGVAIQLIFPCSPPWYENLYGLAPANYSMEGSPAGLARIDLLFGFDMYTTNFTASPLVFGAFPSLHSGNAVLEALFMSHCFPKLRPFVIGYAMWMWWATMYLSHHYAVDLVAGGFLAAIAFYISKTNFLPRIQSDKMFRWDYDYVERGDAPAGIYEYGLAVLDQDFRHDSSDEWTMGSSSSFSSGSRSPTDENGSAWEGDTLASQASDSELSEVIVR
ncbi:e6b5b506-671c-42bf-b6a1-2fe62e401d7a [Sclerotinia trifoliorum]|uniref:E6b5b506-671c-42bf-b6a1-2fe62e401d7a n=1 Tax=Sclerotinia trifoliorum TaxID=28548 RepID=A0A8H2W4F2_9HELO|nr:e6b5b506-671c-42bf-b6a1-2fe62e401d7a [Sclerotinia trifoliorum]